MSKHIASLHASDTSVIVAHQPRGDDNISAFDPVVTDLDTGYMPGPGRAMYVSPIAIVEIVIAGYEIELAKRRAEILQGLQTEVQGLEIDSCSMVVPIAKKEPGLATVFLCLCDGPFYKTSAVLIVQ